MTRIRCAYCNSRATAIDSGIVHDGAYFCSSECYRTALGTLEEDPACPSCGMPESEHMAGDCPGPSIA